MDFNFHSYTIERDEFGVWEVFGHGEYPRDSVLAGQYARIFMARFETLEEAQEAYPTATVPEYSTRIPSGWIPMSDIAPVDFDPADAGERWDEDY